MTGRRPQPLEAVATETGGLAVSGDVADEEHARGAVTAAVEEFGEWTSSSRTPDSGSAGRRGRRGRALGPYARREPHRRVPFVRAAIPAMLERGGGSIVLVSSVSALVTGTASAAYATSKAAMLGLARSVAVDYGPKGIRANAVLPGWVITEMGDRAMEGLIETARPRSATRTGGHDHPAPSAGHGG